MEIQIGTMSVPAPLGRERRVAAVHCTLVHQLQVDVLVVRLYTEVVLEHLPASRAHSRIVFVYRDVHSADERAILKVTVDLVTVVLGRGVSGASSR